MNATVELNNSACVQSLTRIGYYEYVNVCTGKSVYIDWGFLDWTGAALITVFALFFMAFVVFLCVLMVRGPQ